MGTRWRRFRYGTEEINPTWSFYTTVLFMGLTLLNCGLSEYYVDLSGWAYSIVFGIIAIASLGHLNLMISNEKEYAIPIQILDGTYPDLVLMVILGVVFWKWKNIWQVYYLAVGDIISDGSYGLMMLVNIALVLFLTATPIAFLVFLLMSVTRHLTNKKLEKTLFVSLFWMFARKTGKRILERWNIHQEEYVRHGRTAKLWFRRQRLLGIVQLIVMLAILIYTGIVYWVEDEVFLLFLLTVVCILCSLLVNMCTAKDMGIVLDEIHNMAEDAFVQEEPKLRRTSLFCTVEEELLSIQKNRKESVEKQLQSERMKVDLITNVSHDLKTPLTSMIGCIDLLARTEGLPEEAEDYVKLLSVKAGRLREMIQDVFDMAKATSGGQDMNMECLDMTRLIRQSMADMQDRIDASDLIFRIRLDDRELPFIGDGKKLCRVYQNLIENALKYSMAGSRVYVEVHESDGKIVTSVKNTSGYEMDFCAEEIMERFTRGDKSRSTEGNGLGLAIARSFTEACGGNFRVTLDGDLFKVETEFSLLKEEKG